MDNFARKWLGGRVDYDHVYAYQCVDLVKQYWHEVYGVRSGAWGNAIDYANRPNGTMLKYFSKVGGTNPVKGDVVVLRGLPGNPYGHIGIASGRNTGSTVEILEQNGSTGGGSGRGGDAIRYRAIPKSRIAGLLRRKSVSKPKAVAQSASQYVIRAGDTLGAIARRFGLSLANLLKLNRQIKNPNVIYPGQKVTVKGSSAPVARYYTVRRGDTAGGIARTFGITLTRFKQLNPGIKNINLIYPNQKLRVK